MKLPLTWTLPLISVEGAPIAERGGMAEGDGFSVPAGDGGEGVGPDEAVVEGVEAARSELQGPDEGSLGVGTWTVGWTTASAAPARTMRAGRTRARSFPYSTKFRGRGEARPSGHRVR